MASYPKVEKVVYAPQKPTPKRNHTQSLTWYDKWRLAIHPSKNEPEMLMTQVLIGNGYILCALLLIKLPNKNLVVAPKEPPIPINQIIPRHLLLHAIMPIGSQTKPIISRLLWMLQRKAVQEKQNPLAINEWSQLKMLRRS